MAAPILVPVDSSTFAEHALPYGLSLARHAGAPLHIALVHIPPLAHGPGYPLAKTESAQDALAGREEADYLDALVKRVASFDVAVRPVLLTGPVGDNLVAHARAAGVEMVVMATHGRGGVQRAWLGSTADHVVRRCHVPVLLVRPSDATRGMERSVAPVFRRVLCALDGDQTAEAALAAAGSLPITKDAVFTLLRVRRPWIPSSSPYLAHAATFRDDRDMAGEEADAAYLAEVGSRALPGRAVTLRTETDHLPAAAILDHASAMDADLIVMGTHGRGGMRRLLLGSIADRVIRGTDRPVLVRRHVRAGSPAGVIAGG